MDNYLLDIEFDKQIEEGNSLMQFMHSELLKLEQAKSNTQNNDLENWSFHQADDNSAKQFSNSEKKNTKASNSKS